MRLTNLLPVILACLTVSVQAQTVAFNFSQSCLGEQTTFVASSSLNDSAISAWNWDLDDDGAFDDASGKTIVHLFGSSGSFEVSLEMVPNSGSRDTAVESVIIDPLPEVNFAAENLCEGQTAFYSDASTIASGTIEQFNWDFDNDGVTDDTGPTVTYICGPAQTYQSKLTCISDKGCEAFALKTTSVRAAPEPGFSTEKLCTDQPTYFRNETQLSNDSLSNCLWDFGDGNAANTLADAENVYIDAGDYSVTLVSTASSGCRDSISKVVTIEERPDADLIIEGPSTIYGESGVTVQLEGDNITQIVWPNSDNGSSTTLFEPGDYAVSATFENGCERSFQFTIDEDLIKSIEVESDLLTLNGDGINETLIVKNILGGESCSVVIVDRWNNIIYEASDYQNNWDGTRNGVELDAGAYFYQITCGEREPLIGNINVLK